MSIKSVWIYWKPRIMKIISYSHHLVRILWTWFTLVLHKYFRLTDGLGFCVRTIIYWTTNYLNPLSKWNCQQTRTESHLLSRLVSITRFFSFSMVSNSNSYLPINWMSYFIFPHWKVVCIGKKNSKVSIYIFFKYNSTEAVK